MSDKDLTNKKRVEKIQPYAIIIMMLIAISSSSLTFIANNISERIEVANLFIMNNKNTTIDQFKSNLEAFEAEHNALFRELLLLDFECNRSIDMNLKNISQCNLTIELIGTKIQHSINTLIQWLNSSIIVNNWDGTTYSVSTRNFIENIKWIETKQWENANFSKGMQGLIYLCNNNTEGNLSINSFQYQHTYNVLRTILIHGILIFDVKTQIPKPNAFIDLRQVTQDLRDSIDSVDYVFTNLDNSEESRSPAFNSSSGSSIGGALLKISQIYDSKWDIYQIKVLEGYLSSIQIVLLLLNLSVLLLGTFIGDFFSDKHRWTLIYFTIVIVTLGLSFYVLSLSTMRFLDGYGL